MDFADYAELRRQAEKRLTVLSVWPFMIYQSIAYLLMLMRGDFALAVPLVAGAGAFAVAAVTLVRYRRRSGANALARRTAIDDALEEMVALGWPIEDPSPRQLRLLAALLNDDIETRAGAGKVAVWTSLLGAVLWVPSFYLAGSRSGIIPFQGTGFEFFVLTLLALGVLTALHRRARRATEGRVRSVLERATVWHNATGRRAADQWNEYDEPEPIKRKRQDAADDWPILLGNDGEINDAGDALRRLS